MKNYVPDKCPICDNELTITDMVCHKCDTHISGEFYVSRFTNLTKQQLEFVEVFIKCRGSIKEVEKELGISYPTVKNRLEDVATSMGFKTQQKQADKNREILESINKGEMSVKEAMKILDK